MDDVKLVAFVMFVIELMKDLIDFIRGNIPS
jgi:hypothetical protein